MRSAAQRQGSGGSMAAALLLALLLSTQLQPTTAQAPPAAAEPNGQGAILYKIGQWLASNDPAALSALGWSDGGNPCAGWTGVTCNDQGYVTSINLANKGLTGSVPSDPGLWAGLTGLTSVDLAGNSLGGQVPSAIKSAPLLTSVNLSGNKAVCGYLPTDLAANVDATSVGAECPTLAAASPAPGVSPSPLPDVSPSPGLSPLPAPAPASPSPSPAPASPSPSPSPQPSPPPAPVTVISNAPICSCALKGFGSTDCQGALANLCRRPAGAPPACAARARVTNDTAAAASLAQYLGNACFTGQDMDTSICTCVQNLLGNDCAKARVSLCIKRDPLCLPIQNVIADTSGSGSGAAAQQVSSALADSCPIAEPAQPGVKATMEFPDVSMGQYIAQQYTQNVANALSSVTNVPTSAISTLDVRPFVGNAAAAPAPAAASGNDSAAAAAGAGNVTATDGAAANAATNSTGRRMLRQAAAAPATAAGAGGSGNGVQATYFLASDDPAGVSARLSAAANDGTLSARLAQYGITAQAGGLRVQNYLNPPPPPSSGQAGGGFPLWALAIIIPGALLLLGLLGLLAWCCCCRGKRGAKRGKKAEAYAPSKKGAAAAGAAAAGAGAAGRGGKGARGSSPDRAAGKVTSADTGASYDKDYAPPSADKKGAGVGGSSAKKGAAAAGVAAAGAAAAAGTAAAVAAGGSKRDAASSKQDDLPVSRSTRVGAPGEGPAHTGSGNLTPWEASVARTGSGGMQQGAAGGAGAGGGATLSSLTTMQRTNSGGVAAGAAAAAAGSSEAGSSSSPWRSNVRPGGGAAAAPAGGAAATSLANPAAKSAQQAERAKFWAQFQETWQQVRQTQNVDREPGSPSSGTAWTETTEFSKKH